MTDNGCHDCIYRADDDRNDCRFSPPVPIPVSTEGGTMRCLDVFPKATRRCGRYMRKLPRRRYIHSVMEVAVVLAIVCAMALALLEAA